MVDDRTTDGRRLAELLSSELHGREAGPLGRLAVVDADLDADPTADGAFVYAVALDGDRLAGVYAHPDRLRVEFERGVDAAARAGDAADLRVRPKAVEPPRTLVFVADGAAVKRATDVFVAVVETVEATD